MCRHGCVDKAGDVLCLSCVAMLLGTGGFPTVWWACGKAGKGWQLCVWVNDSKCVVTVFKYDLKHFKHLCLRSITVLH